MYIRGASSPSTVLWAFHTIQPSSLVFLLQKMFTQEDSSLRLHDLETENKLLKLDIQTLELKNTELWKANNKLKQSLVEAARSSRPQTAPRGLKPSNYQYLATSATADSGRLTDIELQRKLNENDERFNRTIQELRKQLSDVRSRLTVNEQVTAATQRRQLIQEGLYENLPTNSDYEELRFDLTQEPVYAELQPTTHTGRSFWYSRYEK